MFFWIIPVTLTILGILGFLREPRRLRVGILLTAGLSTALLGGIIVAIHLLGIRDVNHAAWFILGVVLITYVAAIFLALFLIYNGLVMLRREAIRLPNMLSLLVGFGVLAYIALGTYDIITNNVELFTWILLASFPVAYLGFVFLSFIVYAWLYGRAARRKSFPIDAVIVLGAGLMGDRVTPLLAGRLQLGKQTFERYDPTPSPAYIIASGGKGPDETVSEAEAMATWLAHNGVQESRIIKEQESRNTYQNLLFSRQMLQERALTGPVAVVTSDFHAFRAATLMQGVGIDGYALGARTARYYWPTATIREFVALLRDHLRLNVAALGVLTLPLIAFVIASIVRSIG